MTNNADNPDRLLVVKNMINQEIAIFEASRASQASQVSQAPQAPQTSSPTTDHDIPVLNPWKISYNLIYSIIRHIFIHIREYIILLLIAVASQQACDWYLPRFILTTTSTYCDVHPLTLPSPSSSNGLATPGDLFIAATSTFGVYAELDANALLLQISSLSPAIEEDSDEFRTHMTYTKDELRNLSLLALEANTALILTSSQEWSSRWSLFGTWYRFHYSQLLHNSDRIYTTLTASTSIAITTVRELERRCRVLRGKIRDTMHAISSHSYVSPEGYEKWWGVAGRNKGVKRELLRRLEDWLKEIAVLEDRIGEIGFSLDSIRAKCERVRGLVRTWGNGKGNVDIDTFNRMLRDRIWQVWGTDDSRWEEVGKVVLKGKGFVFDEEALGDFEWLETENSWVDVILVFFRNLFERDLVF